MRRCIEGPTSEPTKAAEGRDKRRTSSLSVSLSALFVPVARACLQARLWGGTPGLCPCVARHVTCSRPRSVPPFPLPRQGQATSGMMNSSAEPSDTAFAAGFPPEVDRRTSTPRAPLRPHRRRGGAENRAASCSTSSTKERKHGVPRTGLTLPGTS